MTEALDKWRSRLETVMSETLIYYWINERPRYGKELIKLTQSTISEKIKIPTVYAILNRGKSQGLLIDFEKHDKDKITRGKERKYYRLSEEGKEYFHQLKLYFEKATYMRELFQREVTTVFQSKIVENLSTHNVLNPSYANKSITLDSLSKLDFIILGYLNLHEMTTYNVICKDLGFEYEEVSKSVMILNSLFEIELGEESVLDDDSGLLSLKQKQLNLLNLVFNKIDKTVYSKIHDMTYEDILNMKLIAGVLVLKQEITGISALLRYFREKEIPILSNINHETLLQYIGLISLSKYLHVHITSEGWIITKKSDQTPTVDESTILPGYHWLNYDELIGWLSTIRMTNLYGIRNTINNQGTVDFEINEVLLILAMLVSDGVLDGYIDNDSTLHIIDIHKNDQESHLSKNERILLGFIKSDNRKKLDELAIILGVEIKEVSQLIFQFMGRSNITFEIARDGSIITRNSIQLPVQIQPIFLNIHLQELYGYVSTGQTLEISELIEIWEKPINEIKSNILELVGYGLIETTFSKNHINIISKQVLLNSIPTKLSDNQKALVQNLEKFDEERIKFSEFSGYVKINITNLIKELSVLVAMGVYPNAYFEKDHFNKQGSARLMLQSIACNNCGAEMHSSEKICLNCKSERWFCIVCRRLIEGNETIRSCPFCSLKGHKDHFTNWLLIRSECPSCRKKIEIKHLESN